VIALAILGAISGAAGSQPAVDGLRARRSRVFGWLVLLAVAVFLSTGPEWLTRLPLTLFRYPARLLPFAALAVAALAVIGWQHLRADKRWLDLIVLLVITADLLVRAQPLLVSAPFRTNVVPYDVAIGNSAKLLRFGEVDPHDRAAWISGYLNLYDGRFDAFTAAPLAAARYVGEYRDLMKFPSFSKFANAGVAFVISRKELPPPWYAVASAGNVYVFRNPDAFPMAAHFAPGSSSIRRAHWKLDTSTARVTVNAPENGIVVLRQQAAPGWRVTVDGKPATPLTVDRIFRGVSVEKGRHEIVWKYRPRSLFFGAAITIVTLLTMQIIAFVKRQRIR